MRRLLNIVVLVTLLNTFPEITLNQAKAQPISFQVFYDDLSPYGQWVDYPGYGYVWVPSTGPFTPYSTGGHWVYTDVGWTWVSDYPWGWAPFHYGVWYDDPTYNWIWFPGYEWGPAWVSWRTCPGYFGWAPLGPDVSFGVRFGGYYVPPDRWTFCDEHHIADHDPSRYYASRGENTTIYNRTTVINNNYVDRSRNTTYNAGPKREEVERRSGTSIKPVTIRESSTHGQSLKNNELAIYRPAISKTASNNTKPAPARVTNLKDIKPSQREPVKTNENIKQEPAKRSPEPAKQSPQPAKQQPQPTRDLKQPAKEQPQPNKEIKQPIKEQPQPARKEVQPAPKEPPTPAKQAQPAKPEPRPPAWEYRRPNPPAPANKPVPKPAAPPTPRPQVQPPPQPPPHIEPPRQEPPREERPR